MTFDSPPCAPIWNQLQVLIVTLTSMTTVLASFLAKRRIIADRKRKAWEKEMRLLLLAEFRRLREDSQNGITGPYGP
jgi:hypothetical protein